MPAARPSPRRLASIDRGSNVERNPTVSILALVYTRVPSERATELRSLCAAVACKTHKLRGGGRFKDVVETSRFPCSAFQMHANQPPAQKNDGHLDTTPQCQVCVRKLRRTGTCSPCQQRQASAEHDEFNGGSRPPLP